MSEHIKIAERAQFYLGRNEGAPDSDFQIMLRALVEADRAIQMQLNPLCDRQEAHDAMYNYQLKHNNPDMKPITA